MKRSWSGKVYFVKEDNHSLRAYKKQKNYCSRLYKKRKKKKFNNLSSKFVSDNKLFWNTVKVLFSNIDTNNANIKLTQKMKLFMTKWRKSCRNIKWFFRKCCFHLKTKWKFIFLLMTDTFKIKLKSFGRFIEGLWYFQSWTTNSKF